MLLERLKAGSIVVLDKSPEMPVWAKLLIDHSVFKSQQNLNWTFILFSIFFCQQFPIVIFSSFSSICVKFNLFSRCQNVRPMRIWCHFIIHWTIRHPALSRSFQKTDHSSWRWRRILWFTQIFASIEASGGTRWSRRRRQSWPDSASSLSTAAPSPTLSSRARLSSFVSRVKQQFNLT